MLLPLLRGEAEITSGVSGPEGLRTLPRGWTLLHTAPSQGGELFFLESWLRPFLPPPEAEEAPYLVLSHLRLQVTLSHQST